MTLFFNVTNGSLPNAHSVAVDRNTGNVFVPVPPTATTTGGINTYKEALLRGVPAPDTRRYSFDQ